MDETTRLIHETSDPLDNSSKVNGHVDFNPEGDAENPIEWPPAYKWSIVGLLAFTSFTVTFTCISLVPVANDIIQDLEGTASSDADRKFASVLLVTIWELGEAAGPLLVAPLSELLGRYPVVITANMLFIFATALAALSQSTGLLVFSRALTGLAVASTVLNPAIVGDIFVPEQRGSAMSLIMLAPLLGGAVGPAIAGAVAQNAGWRQVLWMSAAFATVAELASLTLLRETYKVAILRERAARLRSETGDLTIRTIYDEPDQNQNPIKELWVSVKRPFVVLLGSGVLQGMSLFGSVVFCWFYIMATTLPGILEQIYGLSPALTGTAFMSFSIGSTISVFVCNSALDRIYIHLRNNHDGVSQPEYRLPLAIVTGCILPLIVVAYGWIAELRLPLPLLLVSVGLMGTTVLLGILPLMAYVVDAFGIYSASALTAVIVTRCLMSTFMPLTTGPLVARLGYGLGFTVLGAMTLALAPIPVLVFRYGTRWRQGSPFTLAT